MKTEYSASWGNHTTRHLKILPVMVTLSFLPKETLLAYPMEKGFSAHQHIGFHAQFVWTETPAEIIAHLKARWDHYDSLGYNREASEDIITGTAEEDTDRTTDYYCAEPFDRPFCFHFWEPDDPQNGNYDRGLFYIYEYTGSYTIAEHYWISEVLSKYRSDKDRAYYFLGRVAHLLADLTVPAHVHLDEHFFTGPDSLEKHAGDNYSDYSGSSYRGEQYNYKYPIPGFDWSKIEPNANDYFFRLFWYTAQKTQYYASNDWDGTKDTVKGDLMDFYAYMDGDCTSPSGFNNCYVLKPHLWTNEIRDEGVSIVYYSNQVEDRVVQIADACIPHAMKATAALYKLFWESVDRDNDGYNEIHGDVGDCDDDPTRNPGIPEQCDRIDNNCNGLIDEGLSCQCRDGDTAECGTDVGECEKGIMSCVNGVWGPCHGGKGPLPETCPSDMKDNDCDGVIDEVRCDCKATDYCNNWPGKPSPSDWQYEYIAHIGIGHYCAQNWIKEDIDKDGFQEWYLPLGDAGVCFRTWFFCEAQAGHKVSNIVDLGNNAYGCTRDDDDGASPVDPQYCDELMEWGYYDQIYKQPTNDVRFSDMFCDVEGATWGWQAQEPLFVYRDVNNNGTYDQGEPREPVYILRCGRDSDCGAGEYCRKPDVTDVLSYYCEDACGNGICEPGENCPRDGGRPDEICDGIDNNCNASVDEGLSTACSSTTNCPPDGCYGSEYRDYSCDNPGTCNSKCSYSVLATDKDNDKFNVECDNDCDDSNALINPGMVELCDGIDNDCSGIADDNLSPPLCELQLGICAGARRSCGGPGEWLPCGPKEYGPKYEVVEETMDGLDNDCDGRVDMIRGPKAFQRSDSNLDGRIDISDPVFTLLFMFLGGRRPDCEDAADTNDDGKIDLSDAIATLQLIFLGGQKPPTPYPDCGLDATADDLSCEGVSLKCI